MAQKHAEEAHSAAHVHDGIGGFTFSHINIKELDHLIDDEGTLIQLLGQGSAQAIPERRVGKGEGVVPQLDYGTALGEQGRMLRAYGERGELGKDLGHVVLWCGDIALVGHGGGGCHRRHGCW